MLGVVWWLYALGAAHVVWGNTALKNIGPIPCAQTPDTTPALPASSVPHRLFIPLEAPSELWVALYPDADTPRWYNSFVSLPLSWRWAQTQRYQLRLSAPAIIPADWTLDIQAPALPPDTRPATELHPCPVLLARIAAQPTGVPVAPAARTHSQLARLAEAVFGWAAPYSQPAPTSIPVDLTFERLYLGVIPATALRMLPTMLAVLVGPIVLLACGRRL